MFGIDIFYAEKLTYLGLFTTILDLLLVTFILYKFLVLLRGTRAFIMLVGLLLLLFFSGIISRYLDVFTLQWLLANFFNYFFLFIIIIFQNEIRRALTRVGGGISPFFNPAVKQREALEEIIEAVDRMAQIRLGAIIVIEREAELEDQLHTGGEVIDGKVCKEILWSIFNVTSENPLHDGAVIVRKNRLFKAGALLPLSENHEMGQKYGTRHRAALGITENTDAISVVVSEERGTISICEQGQIVEMENLSRLRNELNRLFKHQTLTPAKWWREDEEEK
ncbi:MAG: diadenylate cyclase CdaA [Deltaproteobacteria bacterium]|nr:diadenylate cyclase CdaA [Deltaproteobacteria bacterium]